MKTHRHNIADQYKQRGELYHQCCHSVFKKNPRMYLEKFFFLCKYQPRKKTGKLYRPWWSTVTVCVFHQAHIAPQMGLGRQAKTDYKKV